MAITINSAVQWNTAANSNYIIAYAPNAVESVPGGVVSEAAKFIAAARYQDLCFYCHSDIDAGDPIWWSPNARRVWCGSHKPRPTPVGGSDTNKDNDMAQRHDFTFPYTGNQIADSLDRKVAELDAKISALEELDLGALEAVFDVERNDTLAKKTQRTIKELKQARDKRALEATPYRQAGTQTFDLDLEDIEHFGLNQAEIQPRKVKRTRRAKPRESEPVEVA